MRKFIVYTRKLAGIRKGTDAPSIIEVEGETIEPIEDPSVMWLPKGEFRFRILKPEYLFEPKEIVKEDKSTETIMVPPVYYSHSVCWTVSQARAQAERIVKEGFEFELRKRGTPINWVDVIEKCKEIKEITL